MGLIIRVSSPQEKSTLCNHLRKKGYEQRISPFLNHGFSFEYIAVFDKEPKHFYGCHSSDIDFVMERDTMETMSECNYELYRKCFIKKEK